VFSFVWVGYSFHIVSLESPKNIPEFERPAERLLSGVRRLRELAGYKSLVLSVGAIEAVDTVLAKFPRPMQEFVINSTAEALGGLPISVTSGVSTETQSVLQGVMGISAVRAKLMEGTEK
jgi:hypothetical protein